MPASVAVFAFAAGIAGLFWLDRDRGTRTSPALWIPVVWLLIAASRMVSQWLNIGQVEFDTAEQYLDGSPLDRGIFLALIAGAAAVLAARGRRTGQLLARNWPFVLFFLYCLASVAWSDFPFVALKRWTKAVGNLIMVMVVLTDPDPAAAVRRFLTRAGFILIPVSVLLIKYFPEYGRGYLSWVWTTIYVGAATTKNGLGYVCLLFGLASAWCLIDAMRTAARRTRLRRIVAHGTILVMVVWLFYKANSATSLACFAVGLLLVAVTSSPKGRHPILVHSIVGAMLVCGLASYLFLDAGTFIVDTLGRDSSLSGRTDLWDELLRFANAPWIGTGFESFWLGKRSEHFWRTIWWHPNQAHNGYLETYLNLGWVGVACLTLTIVFGYRNAVAACRRNPRTGPIQLAYLVVAVLYNLTEAAFKGLHPVWIAFMLASTARRVDQRAEAPRPVTAPGPLTHRTWARPNRPAPFLGRPTEAER
jgi:O-antigen ligase